MAWSISWSLQKWIIQDVRFLTCRRYADTIRLMNISKTRHGRIKKEILFTQSTGMCFGLIYGVAIGVRNRLLTGSGLHQCSIPRILQIKLLVRGVLALSARKHARKTSTGRFSFLSVSEGSLLQVYEILRFAQNDTNLMSLEPSPVTP